MKFQDIMHESVRRCIALHNIFIILGVGSQFAVDLFSFWLFRSLPKSPVEPIEMK